jgi:DNA-binding XRE family transcriptional regulator
MGADAAACDETLAVARSFVGLPAEAQVKRGRPRSFKRLLAEARAALGLNKAEAARRLGIPYRTFQNWELGLRTPRSGFTRSAVIEKLGALVSGRDTPARRNSNRH